MLLLFEGISERDCVLFLCVSLEVWYVLRESRPKINIFGLTRKICFGFILTSKLQTLFLSQNVCWSNPLGLTKSEAVLAGEGFVRNKG